MGLTAIGGGKAGHGLNVGVDSEGHHGQRR